VLLGDEEWEATSQSVISAGRRVRVVKMILEVEEE
jgi:membrane-bound ClpP family serine protease